jgi:hypothetical protein
LISTLPEQKQQPNLVLAAARFAGAPVAPAGPFLHWLRTHWNQVVPVVLARSTQTNEAGRCAVLLPALSAMPGPLALLEVGASAGLCLTPDRYSYRYSRDGAETVLDPPSGRSAVVLDCVIDGEPPPGRMPLITWRAGIDLNPLDVRDAEDRTWLEALVWPGQDRRRKRLRAAMAMLAADPPLLVRGDAVEDLAALAARAPADATLVVMHSAVLTYLDRDARRRFASLVADLGAVWLSNEGPGVLPDVARRLPTGLDATGHFVLARNGEPIALTGPHGQSYRALSPVAGGPSRQ